MKQKVNSSCSHSVQHNQSNSQTAAVIPRRLMFYDDNFTLDDCEDMPRNHCWVITGSSHHFPQQVSVDIMGSEEKTHKTMPPPPNRLTTMMRSDEENTHNPGACRWLL